MDINNELLKYLTDDERKKIAERVYEEELRKFFADDINKRDPSIFHNKSNIYSTVLSKYISEMNLTHDEFIQPLKMQLESELQNFISAKYENLDSDLHTHLNWKIQILAEEVINENRDALKEIVKEKVFRCCNEKLLIAFIANIVRSLHLNDAIKKFLANDADWQKDSVG